MVRKKDPFRRQVLRFAATSLRRAKSVHFQNLPLLFFFFFFFCKFAVLYLAKTNFRAFEIKPKALHTVANKPHTDPTGYNERHYVIFISLPFRSLIPNSDLSSQPNRLVTAWGALHTRFFFFLSCNRLVSLFFLEKEGNT